MKNTPDGTGLLALFFMLLTLLSLLLVTKDFVKLDHFFTAALSTFPSYSSELSIAFNIIIRVMNIPGRIFCLFNSDL